MNSQRIGVTVFGLIGVAATIGAAAFFGAHVSFFNRAVETQATVTGVQKLVDQNREAFEVSSYKFTLPDGGVQVGSINGTTSGETFTLWYDPADPKDTRQSRIPFVGIVLSVFGLVFGGIALSQLIKKPSQ
ncbi:MAG: DUF3592 domain-containing protein [Archangium sp.]